MEIDEEATVIVRKEAIVQAPPEVVWRVQTDLARWNRWIPNVAFTALTAPLEPGSIFHWKINGIHTVSRLEISEPPYRIGWTSRRFGTYGQHLWTFSGTESDGATRVESVETASGWATWLLRRTMRRTLELSARLWIGSLTARAEAEAEAERGRAN